MYRYLMCLYLFGCAGSLVWSQPLLQSEPAVPRDWINSGDDSFKADVMERMSAQLSLLQSGVGNVSAVPQSEAKVEPISFRESSSGRQRGTGLQLKQAVHMALQHHPSIADAVATLAQEDAGIDVAKSGYYPQVRMGLGSGNASNVVNNTSSTLLSTSVSQMLYDFGKVGASVKQAKARVIRQHGYVLKQMAAISQQTADATVMVHRFQQLEVIARDQVKAVMDVYELAKLRGAAGLSTQADPIQAWSRVDAARANYLQMRSQRKQWIERLRTLVGPDMPSQVDALPEELLDFIGVGLEVDSDALPDVQIAKADLSVASAQLDQAKAQRLPTFSVDASLDKSLNGVPQATMRPDGTSYSVMFNVSSALFQGGSLQAQIKGAVAAEEAAHKRIETALLNADDQVRSYREQLQGARERLSVLSNRKRTIMEVRNLYREQYTLGTRSILDLLNAEQEIHQSAQDEEAVLHDLWQAWVGLVAATGLSRTVYDIKTVVWPSMEVGS